jgi:hypothetical protein
MVVEKVLILKRLLVYTLRFGVSMLGIGLKKLQL